MRNRWAASGPKFLIVNVLGEKMALKKTQIEKFRERLEEMQVALGQHLQGTSTEIREGEDAKGYSQHQADEGTDDFDRLLSLELSGHDMQVLRQIERALEKIEDGSYGVCDVTNKPIPLKRLEAIPYATTTRDAQEQLEKGLL